MASIERTAYPRFKRFMSVRELHVFYTPQPDEIVWAGEAAGSDGRAGQFRGGYAASVMGSGAWLKPGYQRRRGVLSRPASCLAGSVRPQRGLSRAQTVALGYASGDLGRFPRGLLSML